MNGVFLSEKQNNQKSLSKKTLNLLILILSFFSLVFIISTSIIQRKDDEAFKIRTTETAVENVASSINSTINDYNYISRLIMMNDSVLQFLNAKEADLNNTYEARMGIYDILNLYSNISYIEAVYVFRNDGEYTHTGKASYSIDMTHPEWDRIYARQGGRCISISGNGMLHKTDGSPSLTFSRAIYDIYNQKLKGVLVMSISNNCFEEVLSLQSTDGICILDENRTLLCGDSEAMNFYSELYNNERLICDTNTYKGKRNAVAGKKLPDSLIVLGYTYKTSNSFPLETVSVLFLAIVSCIAAVMYYALFIQKNLSGPIVKIIETMEHTKSLGWKPIDGEMPNSDLSRLVDSYNNMVEYLNELFERLHQEEEMIRKTEIRILHEQIKPHFLYNTLETISYIAVQENASRTYDVLETLGSFYRNFLSGGAREISFQKELSITKDYLSLQKLRYEDSFEDEYFIDEDALDCMVPKLILQPLVENSIYHGVRPKGELCVIRITARKKEDGLHILVYDSGMGMSGEKLSALLNAAATDFSENTPTGKKGIGLTATIARIRYYCNNDDVVTIRSEEGKYTEIELFFPNISRKEGDDQDV